MILLMFLTFLHVQFAGFMGIGMIVMMIFGIVVAVKRNQVISSPLCLSNNFS